MKNKKTKKILPLSVAIITLIIICLIFLVIKHKLFENKFVGTWTSEGGTIYEFKNKSEGIMKTSISEYEFTYKIKDSILSIDFKEKKAIDTDYEYSCKKNKCTFKSDRGTFIFKKNK